MEITIDIGGLMHEVIAIQVDSYEEGEKLIYHLASLEVWVTPFVVIHEDTYTVKAAIPMKDLEAALSYVRKELS